MVAQFLQTTSVDICGLIIEVGKIVSSSPVCDSIIKSLYSFILLTIEYTLTGNPASFATWIQLTSATTASPSGEASSHSTSEEIPTLLRNPKVNYRVYKNPLEALCDILQQDVSFYGEELLTPRLTHNKEHRPLSAVLCYFFSAFAAQIWRPFSPSASRGRASPLPSSGPKWLLWSILELHLGN